MNIYQTIPAVIEHEGEYYMLYHDAETWGWLEERGCCIDPYHYWSCYMFGAHLIIFPDAADKVMFKLTFF